MGTLKDQWSKEVAQEIDPLDCIVQSSRDGQKSLGIAGLNEWIPVG